jgi:ABC-type dipeptide/oligopeptide/nickel transport system permease component
MSRFVLNRLFWFVPTVMVLIALTFLILRFTPGTGVISAGTQSITQEQIEALEDRYGLNDPLPVQFVTYLRNIATLNFGESFQFRPQQVNDIIGRTLPISLQLGAQATAFALIVGITLGVLAAINQNGIIDYFSVITAILFYSLPGFVMGFLLILVFSVWLPNNGVDLGFNVGGLASWQDWILPTVALGAAPLAQIARYTRSSMIEVLKSDYIRTARAKGLSERMTIYRHVMRNSLLPVITLVGPIFAAVGTGSFFVEKVFNIPGMGPFFVESIISKDQPMVLAVVLIYGVFLAVMNLLVDIVYGFVDPRIRY